MNLCIIADDLILIPLCNKKLIKRSIWNDIGLFAGVMARNLNLLADAKK